MNVKILFVESDPALSALLRRRLIAAGYALEHVDDIESASQKLQQSTFQALLLGDTVDDEDALALAGHARNIYNDRIVLSAYGAGGTARRIDAFRLGFDDYVVMPAEAETIAIRLDRALAHYALRLDVMRTSGAPGAHYLLVGDLGREGALGALQVGAMLSDAFRLVVDNAQNESGSIWVKNDSIVGAEYGATRNDEALARIYNLPEGSFRLYEEPYFGQPIDKPIPDALPSLEHIRTRFDAVA